MIVKVSAELIGARFVVVNLGQSHALCEVGSATVEENEHGRWSVRAAILEDSGYMNYHAMPDSFTAEADAQGLADSLKQANESQLL